MLNNNCLKVLVFAIMGMTACANQPAQESMLEERLAAKNFYVSESVEEILQYRVDGWNYVDRRHLILEAGPGDHYLISLATSCHDLGSVEDIAFSTTAGKLTRFDTLLVRGAGGVSQRCHIDTLHKLERIDD
jgi:hypothetical protein